MKHKIKKGFITQKIGTKTKIFDGEESILYTLNESASFVFDKIKQGLTDSKIIELLIKKYSIPKGQAKRDFKELMEDFKIRKILT